MAFIVSDINDTMSGSDALPVERKPIESVAETAENMYENATYSRYVEPASMTACSQEKILMIGSEKMKERTDTIAPPARHSIVAKDIAFLIFPYSPAP